MVAGRLHHRTASGIRHVGLCRSASHTPVTRKLGALHPYKRMGNATRRCSNPHRRGGCEVVDRRVQRSPLRPTSCRRLGGQHNRSLPRCRTHSGVTCPLQQTTAAPQELGPPLKAASDMPSRDRKDTPSMHAPAEKRRSAWLQPTSEVRSWPASSVLGARVSGWEAEMRRLPTRTHGRATLHAAVIPASVVPGSFPQASCCRVIRNAKSPGLTIPGRSHCVEGVLASQVAS